MDTAQQIQEKMRSLGERYLRRTYSEVSQLETCLTQMRSGSREAIKEMERLMHKIRGSGAMFGFAELSDCAGDAELLCVAHPNDPAIATQLETHVNRLRARLHEAARSREVTLEGGSPPAPMG
jgi:chemotaxis protein histidine kinase CheA